MVANRRMFSLVIIDTDAFMDMSPLAQALYFHLGMRADDDGFIGNPNMIKRMTGASDQEMNELVNRGFLYVFESGVAVIRHWKISNTVQKDRYHPTIYTAEKSLIRENENGEYTLISGNETDHLQPGYNLDTDRIQTGNRMDSQPSLDKTRLDKVSIREPSLREPSLKPVETEGALIPTLEEIMEECSAHGYKTDPQRFYDVNSAKGWMIGSTPIKDWKALLSSWDKKEKPSISPKVKAFSKAGSRGYTEKDFNDIEAKLLNMQL